MVKKKKINYESHKKIFICGSVFLPLSKKSRKEEDEQFKLDLGEIEDVVANKGFSIVSCEWESGTKFLKPIFSFLLRFFFIKRNLRTRMAKS